LKSNSLIEIIDKVKEGKKQIRDANI